MKYMRKFSTVSEANTVCGGGVESPHVDLIEETGSVNIIEVSTEKFTCSFGTDGVADEVEEVLPTYTVTLSAGTGGTVSGGGSYTQGTVITITATANSGYKFSSWSDGDTNASRSITVNSDITLSASFEVDSRETWYFNEILHPLLDEDERIIYQWNASFEYQFTDEDNIVHTNGVVMAYDCGSYDEISLTFFTSDSWSVMCYALIWNNENSRTIILDEPATGDLLTFLQANATKQ